MKHRRVWFGLLGVAVLAAGAVAGVSVVQPEQGSPTPTRDVKRFAARNGLVKSARTGDEVRGSYARVKVPRAGRGSCAVAEVVAGQAGSGASEGSETLCVIHANSGSISSSLERDSHETTTTTGKLQRRVAVSECGDAAHAFFRIYPQTGFAQFYNIKWKARGMELRPTLRWYYNNSGAPSNLSAGELAKDYTASIEGWTTNRNACSNVLKPKLAHAPLGATTKGASLPSAYGTCNNDGANVVGWSDLDVIPHNPFEAVLGIACLTFDAAGVLLESDIVLTNSTRVDWATDGEAGSSKPHLFEANVLDVLTHERGHSLGIRHPVSPATCRGEWSGPAGTGTRCLDDPLAHPTLTMGYDTNAYRSPRATLGKGDSTALMTLYP